MSESWSAGIQTQTGPSPLHERGKKEILACFAKVQSNNHDVKYVYYVVTVDVGDRVRAPSLGQILLLTTGISKPPKI